MEKSNKSVNLWKYDFCMVVMKWVGTRIFRHLDEGMIIIIVKAARGPSINLCLVSEEGVLIASIRTQQLKKESISISQSYKVDSKKTVEIKGDGW